jgi:hypothetical protein
MNNSKKNFIALFFIFQICSPAFAMGFFTDNNIIWQAGANEFIKYIDQDTSSPGKNDHPVVLQAKEINTILVSIKFHEQEKDKLATEDKFKSVFTDQQASLLGRYLEQGLKEAKPHQDIIFVLEKSVKRLTLLKPARYFVAGRVFYKDNKLNIIIGDYDLLRNEAFEAVSDPTGTGHIHYSFDYGNRSKPSSFKKTIASINGIENKQQNNTRRGDWLVIDVSVASKAIEHMTSMRKQEEMENRRKEIVEVLGSEDTILIDATNSSEKATRSVVERLTELELLRNKDLITDEEYAQKRKQILDEL